MSPKTVPVQFRLDYDAWERQSARAQALGMTLAQFLRQIIERQDTFVSDLETFRRELLAAVSSIHDSGPNEVGDSTAIAAETLLLLRSLAGPAKMKIVHAELERIGISQWAGSKGDRE